MAIDHKRKIVSFNVDCNNDLRNFNNFKLPPLDIKINGKKKENNKDTMYNILKFQLKELEKVLIKNEIPLQLSHIQGDELEVTNIIKIETLGYASEKQSVKDGEEKNLRITYSVMPSRPYTTGLINEFYAKRIKNFTIISFV
ncbi:hypothetical protein [Paenibacillus sp. JJ-223]|uniref:hypothetical protein n=1 Tax=Paenibacillus sp. JJ-223 TaxID=2905647 RepID=UPI001F39C733|nr:hypothetical protein [Paenibacillus sp. JJ-223]